MIFYLLYTLVDISGEVEIIKFKKKTKEIWVDKKFNWITLNESLNE